MQMIPSAEAIGQGDSEAPAISTIGDVQDREEDRTPEASGYQTA